MGGKDLSDTKIYTGECQFCGKKENVIAQDQMEADGMVTDDCTCTLSGKRSEYEKMMRSMEVVANRSKTIDGFLPLDDDMYRLITELGESIFERKIVKVAINLPDSKLIIAGKKDGVVVRRIRQECLEMEE